MQIESMQEHPFRTTGTNGVGTARSSYDGRRVAFLTQHGKSKVVAPVLGQELGCTVELVSGYDTDRLGTFTRDIPREGTQIDAARRKAHIGMELSGLSLGLASEGSFGVDPVAGLLPWNVELLVWIDAERELEVVGLAQGSSVFARLLTGEWNAIAGFAKQAGFPSHQLVVRPEAAEGLPVRKGVDTWSDLEAAFRCALRQSTNGLVFVETDVRASANPTRMVMIQRAAEDLARKLCSLCPQCATPGFAKVERIGGLRCAYCEAPTRETRAEVFGCSICEYQVTWERTDQQFADRDRCDYCNP